jgi:hypothetical protein
MNLHQHFAEARKVATKRFWSEFAKMNCDREQFFEAPTEIKARCFKAADSAAWAHLKNAGAMALPEWTFQMEKPDGQPF